MVVAAVVVVVVDVEVVVDVDVVAAVDVVGAAVEVVVVELALLEHAASRALVIPSPTSRLIVLFPPPAFDEHGRSGAKVERRGRHLRVILPLLMSPPLCEASDEKEARSQNRSSWCFESNRGSPRFGLLLGQLPAPDWGDSGSRPQDVSSDMESAPELVPLMERMAKTWEAFDPIAVLDAFSRQPGALMIGTDPDEWWEGSEASSTLFRVQLQELQSTGRAIRYEIEEIVAWKEGTVGWIASRHRAEIEGSPPILGRLTLVVHEEGAYWRIVQWHASIGVSNEQSLGMEMTTNVDNILLMVQDEPAPVTALAADGSVTIMFTDIEGSSALMESLGEEAWLELLEWHDRMVKQQTAIFGGTVVKGQGDGFMLAFPATGSAAASAAAIERAVSAGWAGVQVPVRIGLHCGNAKADGGDFFGRTVVMAARLASAAAGGEILISQAVQESLDGAFPLDRARSLSLKGLSGQQAAFPLLWR
ncbi:MAG TPA: adenylate/guanylate cyclase domain-containing protein [Acidimicrobiales bacterium]|nr:adenylate/guanylate cyclase domain-containing protein [Acidimicrobiales bacterium]